MHAGIDQLLNLRDGEPVDVSIKLHLEECSRCAAQMKALIQARQRLCLLPSLEAPPLDWTRVNSAVLRVSASGVRSWVPSAATAATGLILALMIAIAMQSSAPPAAMVNAAIFRHEKPVDAGELQQLIAQSRALDDVLLGMPEPSAVERVALAATVDTIEQRVQWLDWQLSSESEETMDTARTQNLWRERVDLMDSLVKVRYAEAGRLYL